MQKKLVYSGNEAALVFPHQLFPKGPPGIEKGKVYLLEAERFFSDFQFHKKKILFHRASMKSYQEYLEGMSFEVSYINFAEGAKLVRFLEKIDKSDIDFLHYYDPADKKIRGALKEIEEKVDFELVHHSSPGFLAEFEEFSQMFPDRNYQMTKFYQHQRKQLGIMVKNGNPEGGKWSFDPENRKKLPEGITIPDLPDFSNTRDISRHIGYVQDNFSDNPGSTEEFIYPVNRKEAKLWLDDFLENRFGEFGPYEDAISKDETFIFHSVISPLLNVGLLTPEEVVDKAISVARNSEEIELNSLEGFVRQIIGWREYMRLIYEAEGDRQKRSNFWNHTKPIPDAFYTGSTGIPPVDKTIERFKRYGYSHHIERLMIIGNFALLCEIAPDEIFRWFMELSIDSYDWVMTPNVYGMSQYSDGGLITTKPYISSSNYVKKMSDFPTGDWCDIWDGLFWRFINKNSDRFRDIPRAAVMVANLNRLKDETLSSHLKTANDFLNNLFN